MQDKQTNSAKLTWLVYNVGQLREIEHSLSDNTHIA